MAGFDLEKNAIQRHECFSNSAFATAKYRRGMSICRQLYVVQHQLAMPLTTVQSTQFLLHLLLRFAALAGCTGLYSINVACSHSKQRSHLFTHIQGRVVGHALAA